MMGGEGYIKRINKEKIYINQVKKIRNLELEVDKELNLRKWYKKDIFWIVQSVNI